MISPKNPQIPCTSLLSSPQRAEQKNENERFLDNSFGCDDDHHDDSFLSDWDSDNNVQFAQTLSDEEESVHGFDGRTAEVPNHTNDQVGINFAAFNQTEDPSIRELVKHRLGQKEIFCSQNPRKCMQICFIFCRLPMPQEIFSTRLWNGDLHILPPFQERGTKNPA